MDGKTPVLLLFHPAAEQPLQPEPAHRRPPRYFYSRSRSSAYYPSTPKGRIIILPPDQILPYERDTSWSRCASAPSPPNNFYPVLDIAVQKSLFGNAPEPQGLVPIGVHGCSRTLSREQKKFNQLIAQIGTTRVELEVWREFIPQMRQVYLTKVEPALAIFREKRLAMVALLDTAMLGKGLNKTERRKVAAILRGTLRELLTTAQTPELVQLYNKYNGVSFEKEQQDSTDLLKTMASDTFGVNLSDDELTGTPDEIAAHIATKVRAAEDARQARRADKAAKRAQKSKDNPKNIKKAAAKAALETQRTQATQNATKSVREVYRKLASDLHPDREPDPAERERKTALMQKVNQAYNKGDLLELLELQLQIEQINSSALAGMAHERIVHYNTVLTDQLARLRDEMEELLAPFMENLGVYSVSELSPQQVRASHDNEITELQSKLGALDKDLQDFTDMVKLKQNLRYYCLDDSGADLMDELDALLMAGLVPVPRRSRRR